MVPVDVNASMISVTKLLEGEAQWKHYLEWKFHLFSYLGGRKSLFFLKNISARIFSEIKKYKVFLCCGWLLYSKRRLRWRVLGSSSSPPSPLPAPLSFSARELMEATWSQGGTDGEETAGAWEDKRLGAAWISLWWEEGWGRGRWWALLGWGWEDKAKASAFSATSAVRSSAEHQRAGEEV